MQEINNNDEYYKQIFYSNESINCKQEITIKIILNNRFYLFLFIFLILTSQSNALPISPVINNQPLPVPLVQLTERPTPELHTYKVFQHFPEATKNNLPSYSNAAVVQIYDQTNLNNQQQQQQQLKRERQRRLMIDRMLLLFDEDADGQLSKDELYSLGLHLNIFPKFHHFLKQTSSIK